METLNFINYLIFVVFFICYAYQFLYVPVPLFAKLFKLLPRKQNVQPEPLPKQMRYAVLTCARNEETVIGELLDSIAAQDYPSELITRFVLADNCTDETARAAQEHGAVVYERHNAELVGKGYALTELFDHIREDWGDVFDGYFIFDADNLLRPDYINQMNRTFCSGYDIVTSYRNSKNYGDNWISAGYGLYFLRDARYLNQARNLLGTSCVVSGTGFMFSRRILQKNNGWDYHLLSEDIEFTVDQILCGETVGFCPDAVFYDEQPTKFIQSWRQRMRWSKGYLQMFKRYGKGLMQGMMRGSFACFDMTMSTMPALLLSVFGIAANVSIAVMGAFLGDNVMIGIESLAKNFAGAYLTLFGMGLITTISEWKRIDATAFKKLLYSFTFPFFMFTYIPISFLSIFARVTWKPIEHHAVGRLRSRNDRVI
jgi:Glycosyltransferases, probably involved in cell wall biogenesis